MKPLVELILVSLLIAAEFPGLAERDDDLREPVGNGANAERTVTIPLDQIGAVAEKQYSGNGLSVAVTPDGARLRCMFQRMEGRATKEGLWLTSTADGAKRVPFRVKAVAVARENSGEGSRTRHSTSHGELACEGSVEVAENLARFRHPGLTEEYSVSMDGVRQDFILKQRLEGDGPVRVELSVDGAKAEPLVNGARLVLADGQRRITYNRVRAMDARGAELTARMQVSNPDRLKIVVEDADAVYPVRIDPTFTDEDWISMGWLLGADDGVAAAVMDGDGNLYIGGAFQAHPTSLFLDSCKPSSLSMKKSSSR